MANNAQPFEVVGSALTVYFAPVGTTFPLIDAAPAGDWTLVGTTGPLNYDEDGVEIDHSQAFNFWRSLGDAGSRKAFRTEEDMEYRLTLVDLTLEQYRHALNHNAITTVAAGVGTAGYKKVGLSRGLSVHTVALLVRGPSPYMADGAAQWEAPITVQTGNPSPVFQRGEPAGLELAWRSLVDSGASTPDEYFGRFVAQTAAALT